MPKDTASTYIIERKLLDANIDTLQLDEMSQSYLAALGPIWLEVGEFHAASPGKAIELAADPSGGTDPAQATPGSYRAVAKRYVSDVVEIEIETVTKLKIKKAVQPPAKKGE